MLATTSAPTRLRQRRYPAGGTREHILQASLHLFAQKGYMETTVRDIARDAGITDAAIYYYFRNKEDLLHEALCTQWQPGAARGSAHRRSPPQRALWAALLPALDQIEANIDLVQVILREALAGDTTAQERYRSLLDSWEAQLRDTIAPFEGRGRLAAGSAERISRSLVNVATMAVQDRLLLARASAHFGQPLQVFVIDLAARLLCGSAADAGQAQGDT